MLIKLWTRKQIKQMKNLSLILIALVFAGCASLEKRTKKSLAMAYENPVPFAVFCADKYPVQARFIPGKDSIIYREVTVKGDSIPCPANEKGQLVNVKCPDAKILYKETLRVDTVFQVDSAKITVMREENRILRNDIAVKSSTIEELKEDKKVLKRWIIGLGAVVLVLGLMIFRRVF